MATRIAPEKVSAPPGTAIPRPRNKADAAAADAASLRSPAAPSPVPLAPPSVSTGTGLQGLRRYRLLLGGVVAVFLAAVFLAAVVSAVVGVGTQSQPAGTT